MKYGIDTQEDQLRIIKSPSAILENQFGMEPEYLWGTVEKMEADDATVAKATYVLTCFDASLFVCSIRE